MCPLRAIESVLDSGAANFAHLGQGLNERVKIVAAEFVAVAQDVGDHCNLGFPVDVLAEHRGNDGSCVFERDAVQPVEECLCVSHHERRKDEESIKLGVRRRSVGVLYETTHCTHSFPADFLNTSPTYPSPVSSMPPATYPAQPEPCPSADPTFLYRSAAQLTIAW